MNEGSSVFLKEEDLEKVTGGAASQTNNYIDTKEYDCPKCGKKRMFYLFSGGRTICSKCSTEIMR